MYTFFKNPFLECTVCYKSYEPQRRIVGMAVYNRRKYCSLKCANKASERRKNEKVKMLIKNKPVKTYNLSMPGTVGRMVGIPVDSEGPALIFRTDNPNTFATGRNYLLGNEGKFKSGKYQVGNKEYHFRSSWEANYALYLQFLREQGEIKKWEFEADFFDFKEIRHGTTRYLPDFKVTNNDDSVEYFEIKGYMDSRSRTKLTRMAKYFPDVKLTLVDADDYKDLKRKVGKLLKFY